jgi:putative transposase
MALDDSALLEMIEMLRTADGGEVIRRLLGGMLQAVVDAEATAHIGALPHERTEARTTQRNGTRDKLLTTAAGDLTVKIPKVRTGSFFPALLAPRRRIDVALHAVVMQAYVEGASTRRVDDLVIAMGGTGISKSEVSRICAQLDAEVALWRTRTLDHLAFPYLFLDATYCKVRLTGRVVSQAVVIATGVSADGRREVLGCATDDSENEVFWTEFLRDLKDRGLGGVQLVISDAHSGLTKAIGTVVQGAAWQRCRVHFMRNVLAKVSKGHAEMVAATIRTIFAQPGQAEVRTQVDLVADMLTGQFPAVAQMLLDAKADLTAFADFPRPHWQKIWSTNPSRTAQQGGQEKDRRRRDLPQPRGPAQTLQLRPDRGPRRVARQRPPLPQRGVHGAA